MLFPLLFGVMHFGVQFSVQDGMRGSIGKPGVLFCSALWWAILALVHIWGAALYLLAHTIPLHSLIVK